MIRSMRAARPRVIPVILVLLLLSVGIQAQESTPEPPQPSPTVTLTSPPTFTTPPTATPPSTATEQPLITVTASAMPSLTPLPTSQFTPTLIQTPTLDLTSTAVATNTSVPVASATPTLFPTYTETLAVPTATATESQTPVGSATAIASMTPSSTVTASPSITTTPTETPILIEPPTTEIFRDNFDRFSDISTWALSSGWFRDEGLNGFSLFAFEQMSEASLLHADLSEYAVSFDVMQTTGMLHLITSQSAAGDYELQLDLIGTVSLLKNGTLVAATTISTWQPGHWRNVRMSVFDGVIRVAVNSVEIISYQDSAPLPPGQIGVQFDLPRDSFWGIGGIDNFRLEGREIVAAQSRQFAQVQATPTSLPPNLSLPDQNVSCNAVGPASGNRQMIAYQEGLEERAIYVDEFYVNANGTPPSNPASFFRIANVTVPLDRPNDTTLISERVIDPALSPDGTQLAYVGWYEHLVNNTRYVTTGLFVLTFADCSINRIGSPNDQLRYAPDWSADGRWIALRVNDGTQNTIQIIDTQTEGVVSTLAGYTQPRWSNSGHTLAMVQSAVSDLFMLTFDPAIPGNSTITQFTNGLATTRRPSWSADDAQLAIYRIPSITVTSTSQASLPVTGSAFSTVFNFTFDNRPFTDPRPVWSPNPAFPNYLGFHMVNVTSNREQLFYTAVDDTVLNDATAFTTQGTLVDGDQYHIDWIAPDPQPAGGYVITVDEGGSGQSGNMTRLAASDPNDGFCGFREAIAAANSYATTDPPALPQGQTDCARQADANVPPNDYVVSVVSNATYRIPAAGNPITIIGDANPNNDINVVIRPSGSGPTTISPVSTDPPVNVFTVAQYGILILDNIIVTGGSVTGDGGGIYNAGTLILQNGSSVINNTAIGLGGGIYNAGSLTMTGGCLVGNTGLDGSDIYNTDTATATVSSTWWGHAPKDWDGNETIESGPIPREQGGTSIAGPGTINIVNPAQTEPSDCPGSSYSVTCQAQLVSANPGVTQEFSDMRAAIDPVTSTISIHSGPAINAQVLNPASLPNNIIPWSTDTAPTQFTVRSRLQFTTNMDADTNAGQVWYEIELPEDLTFPLNVYDPSVDPEELKPETGWILARVANFEPTGELNVTTPEFRYIEDGDPCGNEVSRPETMTFTYDRRAAAEYAMAHAYRNSVTGTEQYPASSDQVTSRIVRGDPAIPSDNPLIPVNGGLLPNPFASSIPYALFEYPQQVEFDPVSGTYTLGKTGSAMFTSQSYWMGGLPMTFDVDNPDTPDEDESQDTSCPVMQPAGYFGWRYCSQDQVASQGWRAHEGLTAYYSSPFHLVLDDDAGRITSSWFWNTDREKTDIELNITGDIETGYPLLIDPPNRQLFYERYFDPSSTNELRFENIHNVALGDYLYINRSNADLGHGFLVIGWGEITSCPDALGRIWTYDPPLDQQHGQLFTDFADAGTDLVVPYVVDFSGGISFSQLQRVRPRPFYCTFHQNPGSFALEDSYAFYDFPNETTIEVQQLYTPITWTWGP